MQSSPRILNLSFNEDCTAFACGHSEGFKTFHVDTGKVLNSGPVFVGGGAKLVELSQPTGNIAVVGDGASPLYPKYKVLVWNEEADKFIIELDFKEEVLGLQIRADFLVVVMITQIHVFELKPPRPAKFCVIDTGSNPLGLCALSNSSLSSSALPVTLASPVGDEGSLQITNLKTSDGVIVSAHHNALVCFKFNSDASLLATASRKGTCIRVFKVKSGELYKELRRGIEHSLIRHMVFCGDSTRLLVSSEKKSSGTVHMFSLSDEDPQQNKRSRLFSLRGVLPSVFSSEWSFCQFHLEDPLCICAFGRDKNTFVVVGYGGMIYQCRVDPQENHNCKLSTTGRFMDVLPPKGS
eukprot:m.19551 g.19551  ORF g.19551 m.19551 type:complete len:352 (-) comp6610_c0_seq1:80-1135(-)